MDNFSSNIFAYSVSLSLLIYYIHTYIHTNRHSSQIPKHTHMHVESFDGDVCLAGEEDNGTRCHDCSLAYKSIQLTHMWRHKHTRPLYLHSHLHSIHEFIDKSMCLVFCMKQSLIYTLIYKNTRIRYIIFLNINIQQNIFKYIHEYILYIQYIYIHIQWQN